MEPLARYFSGSKKRPGPVDLALHHAQQSFDEFALIHPCSVTDALTAAKVGGVNSGFGDLMDGPHHRGTAVFHVHHARLRCDFSGFVRHDALLEPQGLGWNRRRLSRDGWHVLRRSKYNDD